MKSPVGGLRLFATLCALQSMPTIFSSFRDGVVDGSDSSAAGIKSSFVAFAAAAADASSSTSSSSSSSSSSTDPSTVVIDLSRGTVKGYDSRIQFLVPPTAVSGGNRTTRILTGKCSQQALLKVSLGRKERLVRIQLQFLRRSKQWSFHLSDSPHARAGLRYVDDVRSSRSSSRSLSSARRRHVEDPFPDAPGVGGRDGSSDAADDEDGGGGGGIIEPYSELWLYNGLLNVLGDNEYRAPQKSSLNEESLSTLKKRKTGTTPIQIFGEPIAKTSSRRARTRRRSGDDNSGKSAGTNAKHPDWSSQSERKSAGQKMHQKLKRLSKLKPSRSTPNLLEDSIKNRRKNGKRGMRKEAWSGKRNKLADMEEVEEDDEEDADEEAGPLAPQKTSGLHGRRKLKILAGKNFLSWKGDNYQDYLPHDSLFTFRQSGDRVFYLGLNRVVESQDDDAAIGDLSNARRDGSGLCKVIVSLSRPRDDCTGQKNDCGPNAICKRATEEKHVCICKPGWQRSGKACVDYDECRIQNGGCVHHCLNYEGNFTCGCREGFQVDPASPSNCIDVDECAATSRSDDTRGTTSPTSPLDHLREKRLSQQTKSQHGCEQGCRNTIGSYECYCHPGFMLSPDGHSCVEMDEECEELNCSHMCTAGKSPNHVNGNSSNNGGGGGSTQAASLATMLSPAATSDHHQQLTSSSTSTLQQHAAQAAAVSAAKKRCRCFGGFFPNPPNYRACRRTCAVGNGGCQHYCRDSRKGPVCSCHANYVLAADNATCLATCEVNNGGCEGICAQSRNGTLCSCPEGYELDSDGRSCTDVNECATGAGNCSHECRNSDGGHECLCPAGLKLASDQRTCVDVDECQMNGTCQFRCVNGHGSYSCACPAGYQLFGSVHCGDFDECAVNNGGCSQICANTPGAHECKCRPGFRLHPNGRDCVDATVCLPLPTPSKATMVCSTSYDGFYEETCDVRCDGGGGDGGGGRDAFLLRSASNARRATLTCGARTRYEWMDADGNDGLPLAAFGCSEQTAPLVFRKEAILAFKVRVPRGSSWAGCGDLEPRTVASVRSDVQEQMNGILRSTCDDGLTCDVRVVDSNCTFAAASSSSSSFPDPDADYPDNVVSTDDRGSETPSSDGGGVATFRFLSRFSVTVDEPTTAAAAAGQRPRPRARLGGDGDGGGDADEDANALEEVVWAVARTSRYRAHRRRSRRQQQSGRRQHVDGCGIRSSSQPPIRNNGTERTGGEVEDPRRAPVPDCEGIRKRIYRRVQRTAKQIRIAAKKAWKDGKRVIEMESLRGLSASAKFKKWSLGVQQVCPGGHESNGIVCIGCGLGSYLDSRSGLCKICPPGTYQDEQGSDSCKQCPEIMLNSAPGNGNTPGEAPWLFKGLVGATSLTECSGACPPGTFSRNGRQPCKPCPKGTFQTGHGRTECEPCGANSTTVRQGATSFQVCLTREICRAGSFWNKTEGLCQICPKGFYQPQDQRDFCFACPANSTTEASGSKLLADCRQTTCGQFSDGFMGYLETPNYPGHYPVGSTCTWIVRPPRGKRLLFVLPELKISPNDSCEDYFVLRKSSNPQSRTSFLTCDRLLNPIAVTARSRNIWAHFQATGNLTSAGFRMMYVVYNAEYQPLIEEIIKDPGLLSTQSHVRVFQDPELLAALMEVIAQPVNYYKYVNVQSQLFPASFINLLTPKVRKFLSYR